VLGHALWQRAFGGRSDVLGPQTLLGHSVRVVAVMGPGVKFPGETQVWIPIRQPRDRPASYARLVPGAATDGLSARFPELEIKTLADAVRPDEGRSLVVLFAGASLLLLVAWVQVAALVFAGIIGRVHELGVRLALGASRMRVATELAVENALLSLMAFALASVSIRPVTVFV